MTDPNRYLQRRKGRWFYRRRVPARLALLDERAPLIRCGLGTADVTRARTMRDELEAADDAYWAGLDAGPAAIARASREAAAQRALALGFEYQDAEDIAAGPLEGLLARLDALRAHATSPRDGLPPADMVEALLGGAPALSDSVRSAFRLYLEEIEAGQRRSKSPKQYRKWRQVKTRAVNNFLKAIGEDKGLGAVTRTDGRQFHRWLQARIDAGQITPATAARDLGNMRQLFREYMAWTAPDYDGGNPFDGLKFKGGQQQRRPPFPTAWIRDRILAPGALAGMDAQARDILLILIETGARPGEVANLNSEAIKLDAGGEKPDGWAPYLDIRPREGREIKTRSSARRVPLVGVSLAAMRRNPQGFPAWRENEKELSDLLLSEMRDRGLMPSGAHVVYSLRHSFEDRMKEAGLDAELRAEFMGHAVKRPQYGGGVSMEWKAAQLQKIALPFSDVVFN